MRQVRPRNRATTRIANHSRKITNDENRLVTQILKLSQFSQNDGVAKMNIGCCGIHPEFHPQRPTESEFVTQLTLADNLRGALF